MWIRRATRKLDEHQELHVVGIILQDLSLYLGELGQRLNDDLDIIVSPATLCKLLTQYGITREKIRRVAQQRCDSQRGFHCPVLSV